MLTSSGARVALVLLGVCLSGSAPAAQSDAEEARAVLAHLSTRYRGLTAARFEGYSSSLPDGAASAARVVRRPFAVAFASGGRLRQESTSRATPLIVSDGKSTWIHRSQFQQYKVLSRGSAYTLAPVERLKRATDRLTSARLLPDETIDIEGASIACRVVEGTYAEDPDEDTQRASVRFWIDRARDAVVQERALLVAVDPQATPTPRLVETTVYTLVELDPTFPDGHFSFAPAPGDILVDEFQDPTLVNLTGQRAPEFALTALDGRRVSLADLRGRVVILDFWASWCKPCVVEMPVLQKLWTQLESRGVVVLGINNEAVETARAFLSGHGVTFTTLSDPSSDVARRYQVKGIPVGAVVDRDGTISSFFVGLREESVWRNALEKVGVSLTGAP
ncbi:MAG: redoxin domain-containing protein [Vicinamibacterales bacterium]